jgi:hypothetical protein
LTRLEKSVMKGESSVYVSTALDWKEGDEVALMPTATQSLHTDYMTIESYDASTGQLNFTSKLMYYHFGDSVSTAAKYNGVDMRGEVVLLSRSIVI